MNSSAVSLFALVVAAPLRAGPTDLALVAAMRLSEESNYSWVSFVQDDARSYEVDGKLMRDGFTWVRMPMINEVAERLGRAAEYDLEALFHGNATCVLRTETGWKTVSELPRPIFRDDPGPPPERRTAAAAPIPGASPPTLFARLFTDDFPTQPYSNLQLAVSPPHEELAIIVSTAQGLCADAGTVTGTLSARGAQLLLLPAARPQVSPLATSGAFRLWIKDHRVLQYRLQLEAVLIVGNRKIAVHQTAQTVVTAVGTSAFEVPDEARLKLALAR